MHERLRKVCAALPESVEVVSFGHPGWQVKKKGYAYLEEYKGELCIVVKAELPVQQALVKSPRFFIAPYIGKHGWVSLRVGEGKLDWGEIGDLVRESWRLVAAKSLAAGSSGKKKAK